MIVIASNNKSIGKTRVRRAGEDQHEDHESVVLSNVKFVQTSREKEFSYEEGFGCGIAAKGEIEDVSDAGYSDLKNLVPLEFNVFRFETPDGEPVESARVLIINKHGVFAVL